MSGWMTFFLGMICGYIATMITVVVITGQQCAKEQGINVTVDQEPSDYQDADFWKYGEENPLGEPV